jgi:uroporphyrin-III C-methyltransferase/precorrin-2 dehydrogenase/sirohydrochlorin ferrochelatase
MASSEAAAVRDRLLADGVDPATPVAIVENGTRPDERVSTGRLADLTRLAASHLSGPSLIIVGEVAARAAVADEALAKVS